MKIKQIMITLFLFATCIYAVNAYAIPKQNPPQHEQYLLSNVNQDEITKQNQSSVTNNSDTVNLKADVSTTYPKKVSIHFPTKAQHRKTVPMEVLFAEGILPQNAIPSIKIETIQKPEHSTISLLVGIPITKISFDKTGAYTILARIGYLLKSS